jgi:ABC-type dipeptide/oligopeptide/nickel transport system permease component
MNKRVFLLILFLLLVLVFISAKIYFSTKKEVLQEYNYYIKLEKKVKEVNALKQKYKLDKNKLNSLKQYCNILDGEKVIVKCNNLDKNKFNVVQNIIFRSNFRINKFNIEKNKTISLEVEILK